MAPFLASTTRRRDSSSRPNDKEAVIQRQLDEVHDQLAIVWVLAGSAGAGQRPRDEGPRAPAGSHAQDPARGSPGASTTSRLNGGWVLMTRSPSPSSSAGNANALGVAKLWANRLHPGEKPGDGQLVGYLVLIGYTVPPDGG